MDDSILKDIILEKEQEDLLCTIVEAARNVPSEKREEFYVVSSSDGHFLQHNGFPEGEIEFHSPDLGILIEKGLILVTGTNKYGVSRFAVTPEGFQYYRCLKKRSGESVEHVEKEVRSYIDSHDFQKRYKKAYEKWSEAESLLWETETPKQLTKIGHLCREAIQEFMDVLFTQANPPGEPKGKDKTEQRLSAIIEVKSQKLGKTERRLLRALYKYWQEVNDLIQKQVHGALKEEEELVWDDARRVVFQTMMLMFEVSHSLK